ncbi:transcription initiation factor TFIID subunit 5 [Phtheirospermum japonicum]|uniref:Transcription initiation factor TFIID subunit 5 n=1 Tax=Phtheirospermum japonicum TaxID=374723 RepID=A0A830B4Q3_9LAMI|nr:transcription initiation factor TFIID subunit 5 [Phtheirospermum japonicum]
MDQEEIDKVVLAYLDKRGFKQADLSFQQEKQHHSKGSNTSSTAQIDPDITKQLLAFSEVDIPAQYQEGYGKLRSWAYNSLDQYQHELVRVLYPVFVHGFMELVAKGHIQEARAFFNSFRGDHEVAHSRDLHKLEGVLTPSHLEEMEFAHSLRQSKVNLKICQYSYELLLQFLHKSQSITILGIINEHINFQVSPGQLSSIAGDAEFVTLGSSQDAANLINQKEIHWGLLEDSLEEKLEKTGVPNMDSEKAEMREGDLEENKKRPVDGSKQSSTLKKSKKEKVLSATAKTSRPENVTMTEADLGIMDFNDCFDKKGQGNTDPAIMGLGKPVEVEHSILEDLRKRVQLSSMALPSISFYTFINTHNGSARLTEELTAKVIGTDRVKVSQLPMSICLAQMQWEDLTHYFKVMRVLFILPLLAPSGTFFYLHHQIQQFSPAGHYFASASHDRTARIWSVDRIKPLRIMAGHLSDVDCVQWHANCTYVATGSSDRTVRLWDVQSGECVRMFIGHRSMILCLAMSPDGRYMASGDEDGTIMICEGSLLASGSADSTVKLWDVATSSKVSKTEENSKSGSTNRLRSLKTLPTKSTPVYALQFSRRNLLFAAGALSKRP